MIGPSASLRVSSGAIARQPDPVSVDLHQSKVRGVAQSLVELRRILEFGMSANAGDSMPLPWIPSVGGIHGDDDSDGEGNAVGHGNGCTQPPPCRIT